MQAHYPDFIARLEAEDRPLPEYVREEFETYLRCGVLEHGFLRVVCEHCRAERLVAYSCKKRGLCPSCGARRMAESARHLVDEVFGPRPVRQWVLSFPYPLRFLFASKPEAIGPVLGIVHRVIAGWLADQAGVPRDTAQCGVVTLIQRFGSALNLNIHFHKLFLDGVYSFDRARPKFHRAPRPTPAELVRLLHTISTRVARLLERQGLLVRDAESEYLDFEPEAFEQLIGASIHYRIAIGPNAGKQALTLRTIPAQPEPFASTLLAKQPGFSLHAATVCEANQRDKLEELCRYITRPAIANERLSTNERGQIV